MVLERPVSEVLLEGISWIEISDHKSYTITLRDTFRKMGIQIIVKIDSIELTPDKPIYHGSVWQLEGQMNENIVATP
jgi:hypothetical protein